jgi:hypothetical protein
MLVVEVPRAVSLAVEPLVATRVEARHTVTSLAELRAVVIPAPLPRTVSLAQVPRAATQAAARRTVTSVVEPRAVTLAVTPVAVLPT